MGITGAHQAGIHIPKNSNLLNFFPQLNDEEENPRRVITFVDEYGNAWKFHFIYYNNKLRGGTRDEYRLTGMTTFFKQMNAKQGDLLVFENSDGEYHISVKTEELNLVREDGGVSLILNSNWKVIKY